MPTCYVFWKYYDCLTESYYFECIQSVPADSISGNCINTFIAPITNKNSNSNSNHYNNDTTGTTSNNQYNNNITNQYDNININTNTNNTNTNTNTNNTNNINIHSFQGMMPSMYNPNGFLAECWTTENDLIFNGRMFSQKLKEETVVLQHHSIHNNNDNHSPTTKGSCSSTIIKNSTINIYDTNTIINIRNNLNNNNHNNNININISNSKENTYTTTRIPK